MIAAIADTHAAIWYLFSDSRLGPAASAFIDQTTANGDHIGISAITVAEMVYLIEKKRISANALNDLHTATVDPKAVLQHVPLDEKIAMKRRSFLATSSQIFPTGLLLLRPFFTTYRS